MNQDDSLDNLASEKKEPLEAKYDETAFPSLVVRIKALFVDLVIILVIFTATTLFIDSFGDIPNAAKGFILIFMLCLYDPLLTSLTGNTLGQKIMNLKIGKYREPEKNISLGQAFLRYLSKALLGWVSFLTVTSNKRKRAIHDLASGSIVLWTK